MGKLAITGGKPVRTEGWPGWPVHDEREVELVSEVVRSGNWSYDGQKELEFAQKFAEFIGTKHGFCVTGGTAALEISLRAAGVGAGDEVILPAETFIATASCIVYVGAVPVFVDVEPDTYCIDPKLLEAAITGRTSAIIPVHLFGCMADMDGVMEVAKKHNLRVIEDCAHTHGSRWNGVGAGAIGNLGAFSLQQSKPITCGEGGVITTNDDELAERCYSFKNCGRTRTETAKHVVGGNYRITEMQAAILLAQLERLPGQVERRDENAIYLTKQLAEIDGIQPLKRHPQITKQSYYAYVFNYDQKAFNHQPVGRFVEAMRAEGIPVSDGLFGPVYKDALFAIDTKLFPHLGRIDYAKVHCPVAENAGNETVTFGHSVLLGTKNDMDNIAEAVRKIRANVDEL